MWRSACFPLKNLCKEFQDYSEPVCIGFKKKLFLFIFSLKAVFESVWMNIFKMLIIFMSSWRKTTYEKFFYLIFNFLFINNILKI